uniref:Serine/threonine-protein kinase PLK n=1 Tax=Panagrolaimus sp. JU765 TaxID=591449 RepID=A0AC34R5V4_9BILA
MPPTKSDKNVMPVMPTVVCDERRQEYYSVGEFLGKGGFAACYRLTDGIGTSYAGKVVGKHLIKSKAHSDKLSQEICIHQKLGHKHIVKLFAAFEDTANVYLLLELCTRRSLMELLQRRKQITEPEARYFIKHLASACSYIHKQNIIHRDLKLGNLFLSDDMVLKVGDFGLATIFGDGARDKSWLCGTPNYIAPEVLAKKQHTVKLDIWAIGCVLFALLTGTPPFETRNLSISENDYNFPANVGMEARSLIKVLLSADPNDRPPAEAIPGHPFMRAFTPKKLPISCLTTQPVFPNELVSSQTGDCSQLRSLDLPNRSLTFHDYMSQLKQLLNDLLSKELPKRQLTEDDLKDPASQLLNDLLSKELPKRQLTEDDLKDPASVPVYWVSKWVDYSAKYGFAYQLCDGSFATAFSDRSSLIMDACKEHCQYRSKDDEEAFFSVKRCPKQYEKKLSLLNDFEAYMTQNLAKAGESMSREGDELARLPYLQCWIRTKSYVIFFLSNGTYQCNFLADHSKVILCPLMKAATMIDSNQVFHTYKFETLMTEGAPSELLDRLGGAYKYLKLIQDRHKMRSVPVNSQSVQQDSGVICAERGAYKYLKLIQDRHKMRSVPVNSQSVQQDSGVICAES